MKKFNLMAAAATAVIAMGMAGSAGAVDYAYMTGVNPPWGQNTNEAAMDAAFGAGLWDASYGFSNSVFTSGYAFVFFDGGDGAGFELGSFLSTNLSSLETFVNSGGRVLIHAARNDDYSQIQTGFGTSLTGSLFSNVATVNANGVAANLDANGAGTEFTGSSFSHDAVSGVDVCYIDGEQGCIFGAVTEGLFVGGETTTNFHYSVNNSDGFQLRVNELNLAATGAVNVGGAVPEPATWALMIGGFGLAGAALRRRRTAVA